MKSDERYMEIHEKYRRYREIQGENAGSIVMGDLEKK
jgi:hypothetical protein